MYGKTLMPAVLPAAVILPNTGSNRVMAVMAITGIVVGVVAIATTIGSVVAKRAYKA